MLKFLRGFFHLISWSSQEPARTGCFRAGCKAADLGPPLTVTPGLPAWLAQGPLFPCDPSPVHSSIFGGALLHGSSLRQSAWTIECGDMCKNVFMLPSHWLRVRVNRKFSRNFGSSYLSPLSSICHVDANCAVLVSL